MLTIISKIFGNNGKFLPESPFPLRHPKKNHPVTLCQPCSRLHQEPLFPAKTVINVGGLAGFQSLSSLRHFGVHVSRPPTHVGLSSCSRRSQTRPGTCWLAPHQRRGAGTAGGARSVLCRGGARGLPLTALTPLSCQAPSLPSY